MGAEATRFTGKVSADIRKNGISRYLLTMRGKLEPGWMGRLCTSLGLREINIVRGNAAKVSSSEWSSLFDLDFPGTVQDPSQIDFVALTRNERASQELAPVMLYNFVLEHSAKYEGSLYVEVTGEDRLGFLSSLLNAFSLFSLFPVEMVVETKQNKVLDRFWLKGLGGAAPSGSAAAALGDILKTYSRGKGGNA